MILQYICLNIIATPKGFVHMHIAPYPQRPVCGTANEAQTYEYRTRSTQCKREAGTQMEKVSPLCPVDVPMTDPCIYP